MRTFIKDLLIRSISAAAVLGCGLYFAFGVAAGAAVPSIVNISPEEVPCTRPPWRKGG